MMCGAKCKKKEKKVSEISQKSHDDIIEKDLGAWEKITLKMYGKQNIYV